MPRLRTLSGDDIIKILGDFGFTVESQKGSHVKLRRLVASKKQTLTIPNHKEIDKGTIKAIYTQVLRYLPEDKIYTHFYTE